MKSTDAPSKQAVPFGSNGPREAITATTPSGSNQASYDQGFPPITMTLKSAGGLPPKGQDMNQILFEQSSFNRYFAAGGGYVYDSAFSTAVGGYPLSARIPNSTGTGFWLNTVEDNQTNPENSTSALTGWVPMGSYGATTISGLASSSVTLTTLQASKDRVVLSGNLTGNINLVLPAWIKSWTIVNGCSGSFGVNVKTPSGSGVLIPAGLTATIFGDGTNIYQYDSMYGVPGRLLNTQVFVTTGQYTPTPGTKRIIVEAISGGGGSRSGSTASGQTGGSTPGYHGQYNKSRFDISAISTPLTVTVGLGGAANSYGGGTFFGPYMSLDGGNPADATLSSASPGVAGNAYHRTGATNTSTGFIISSSQGEAYSSQVVQVTAGTAAGFAAPNSPFPGGWQGRGADGIYAAAGQSYTGKTGNPGMVIVWEYS